MIEHIWWLEMECSEGSAALRRDTCGISESTAGVRVVIVARKPGNSGGAKDDRKIDRI